VKDIAFWHPGCPDRACFCLLCYLGVDSLRRIRLATRYVFWVGVDGHRSIGPVYYRHGRPCLPACHSGWYA